MDSMQTEAKSSTSKSQKSQFRQYSAHRYKDATQILQDDYSCIRFVFRQWRSQKIRNGFECDSVIAAARFVTGQSSRSIEEQCRDSRSIEKIETANHQQL